MLLVYSWKFISDVERKTFSSFSTSHTRCCDSTVMPQDDEQRTATSMLNQLGLGLDSEAVWNRNENPKYFDRFHCQSSSHGDAFAYTNWVILPLVLLPVLAARWITTFTTRTRFLIPSLALIIHKFTSLFWFRPFPLSISSAHPPIPSLPQQMIDTPHGTNTRRTRTQSCTCGWGIVFISLDGLNSPIGIGWWILVK